MLRVAGASQLPFLYDQGQGLWLTEKASYFPESCVFSPAPSTLGWYCWQFLRVAPLKFWDSFVLVTYTFSRDSQGLELTPAHHRNQCASFLSLCPVSNGGRVPLTCPRLRSSHLQEKGTRGGQCCHPRDSDPPPDRRQTGEGPWRQ